MSIATALWKRVKARVMMTPRKRNALALAFIDRRMEMWRAIEDNCRKAKQDKLQVGAASRLSELALVREYLA